MQDPLHIGIIGDLNPQSRHHRATQLAIRHAAAALSMPVEIAWLPTPDLEGAGASQILPDFDGLWCAPGSPYASMQGALDGIRYAREKGKAFVGT